MAWAKRRDLWGPGEEGESLLPSSYTAHLESFCQCNFDPAEQWVLSTVGAIYTNNNYSLPSAENQERGTISAHTTAMNCLCIRSAPDLYQQCVRQVSQLLLLAHHAVNIITHRVQSVGHYLPSTPGSHTPTMHSGG